MGTEDAIVFTTGHQANVGTLGTLLEPGDTVIVDSGDHASILDGCLLSRAKLRAVPPQPPRQARDARWSAAARRRRRRARRRRRRVLDGGRRRPAAGDRRAVRALRRAAHGRRGARAPACSARAAPATSELLRRRGPASTCAWARSRSRWPRAAASSPGRPTSSSTCASAAPRLPLHGASAVPAAVGAALAALRDHRAPTRAARCSPGCSANARHWTRRPARARLQGRRAATRRRRRRDADRPGPRRGRLEGRAAVEGALRRGRVRQRRAAPRGPARRRAAAHERHGDPRRGRCSIARSTSSPT